MWFSAVNISPLVMPFMLSKVPGVLVPTPTFPPSLTTNTETPLSCRSINLPVPFWLSEKAEPVVLVLNKKAGVEEELPSMANVPRGVVEPRPRKPLNEVKVEVALPVPKLISPPITLRSVENVPAPTTSSLVLGLVRPRPRLPFSILRASVRVPELRVEKASAPLPPISVSSVLKFLVSIEVIAEVVVARVLPASKVLKERRVAVEVAEARLER